MPRAWLNPLLRILASATVVLGLTGILWVGITSQSSTPVSAGNTHVIMVGDLWFCNSSFQGRDCSIHFRVGDHITWNFDSASSAHTITECDGSCGIVIDSPESRLWHSGNITSGIFKRTFNTPGTFEYQCNIHPGLMRGTIMVKGAEPTLPMPPSPVPSETATAAPTSTTAPVPTSTPSGLPGDVNGDGLINPIDAALVLQFSAEMLTALSSFDRADVNHDGMVNAVDAALILQFVAGLLTTL